MRNFIRPQITPIGRVRRYVCCANRHKRRYWMRIGRSCAVLGFLRFAKYVRVSREIFRVRARRLPPACRFEAPDRRDAASRLSLSTR